MKNVLWVLGASVSLISGCVGAWAPETRACRDGYARVWFKTTTTPDDVAGVYATATDADGAIEDAELDFSNGVLSARCGKADYVSFYWLP